mmetsp:Transcript_27215/g.55539  ORF Transcript_27215/g.55539 Transcript_27215/m.55539 type:complete len:295 (+) Transcript_27215:61-945(+)
MGRKRNKQESNPEEPQPEVLNKKAKRKAGAAQQLISSDEEGSAEELKDKQQGESSTPTKPATKSLIPVPRPSPKKDAYDPEKPLTVLVTITAMTWSAWTMRFTLKVKGVEAFSGTMANEGSIAWALANNCRVPWSKERMRKCTTADPLGNGPPDATKWMFVRVSPDQQCDMEGYNTTCGQITKLFEKKKKEWQDKPQKDLDEHSKWNRTSWLNNLTFELANHVNKDNTLDPKCWDTQMHNATMLFLANTSFPETSLETLDEHGGFFEQGKQTLQEIRALKQAGTVQLKHEVLDD